MQALTPLRARAIPTTARLAPRTALLRTALRAARPARRYATTEASPAASGGGSGALAGGLAGGLVTVAIAYTWYRVSGTKSVVDTARQSKSYLDNAFRQTTEKAPNPSQAISWLKDVTTSYTKFIPGANQYVDQAFKDLEKVQEKHSGEVEKIVSSTYDELKDVTKGGATAAAAYQAWDVLSKALKKIGDLAGDAAGDILENHPELKDKVGGQYKQLKQMADSYGPEAKKQFDDTSKQVQDIIKGGLSSDNIQKAQKLVQDKVQELKKYGDKAWDEGLKKAQPVLDKYPELKDQVEKNKDKLLQGDLGQLWDKVQKASESGSADDVKKFVQEQVQQGQKSLGGSGGGIESLLSMFPGGKDVGGKLQQLQELSQKHGQEAEKLIKSAFDDIKGVLDKKVEEGKSLKQKAEKDAKSS